MTRCRARGSAFIAVVAVLALLSILMQVALQLLVAHVSESRRRGDSAYAGELARSGLAWARACIATGSSACTTRLDLPGGRIAVDARFDGEAFDVTARGTVLRSGADGPSREAQARITPPPPGEGVPAGTAPPPAPEPAPEPTPAAPEPGTNELSSEEYPRHF